MCLYGAQPSASCDDGYIDCTALSSSSRKPSQSATHREHAPLLSKSSTVSSDTSVEDLTDVAVPSMMYQCLSRSFSVGSQLSAAASTSIIHEESFSDDLTLDDARDSSRNEYLPMSRISSAAKDKDYNNGVVRKSSACSNSEKSPLLSGRSDVDPKPSSVSRGPPTPVCDYASVVPSSVSASYQSARDESGYLMFRPTTTDGGSLERLGPPPEVPTSAGADYVIPALPPKQHPPGQRANSLLLSGRPPHMMARRRGSADSWGAVPAGSGPAVPPRDLASAGINMPLASMSNRPTAERRARKPNLTVNAVASANSVNTGETDVYFGVDNGVGLSDKIVPKGD